MREVKGMMSEQGSNEMGADLRAVRRVEEREVREVVW